MYFNKVLILDNYDSFTYNLLHIVEQFCDVDVKRNDEILIKQVDVYDAIIISPGPGLPKNSGKTLELINTCKISKPILGVCLGFQAIAEYFGSKLINLDDVKHGVDVEVEICSKSKIFNKIPLTISVGLYHSWAAQELTINKQLKVTAKSVDGVVMAIEHQILPIYGVQFHPESIMTPFGKKIIQNFLTF